MAGFRKRGKIYFARVRKWNGIIQEELPPIPLNTSSKSIALIRKKEVEKFEEDIKNGVKVEFSWQNEDCETKIINKTINDTIKEWLIIRKTIIRKSHLKRNKISMDRFLEVINGNRLVNSISLSDIENFKIYYSMKHFNGGININLRAIKTFLKWCYEVGYLDKIFSFKLMPISKGLPKYISESEFSTLMKLDIDGHYKRAFWFFLTTGCRKSEPFDGYLNNNWLIIRAEDSKTNSERQIQLDNEQIVVLEEMKIRLKQYIDSDYNRKTFIDSYNKVFVKACKKIGIYKKYEISLHSLRHSFAVMKYLETDNIYQVKMELGHENISTTEIYTKFHIGRLQQDFPSFMKARKIVEKSRKKVIRDINLGTIKELSISGIA